MATTQENLDAAKKKIDELQVELAAAQVKIRGYAAEAGREIDDRFRAAVDPIGQSAETKYGLTRGSLKDPVRIAAWVVVAVLLFGGLYLIFLK